MYFTVRSFTAEATEKDSVAIATLTKKVRVMTIVLLSLLSQVMAFELNKMAMFGLGFASGVYVHELGHAAMILAVGGKVDEIGWAYTKGSKNGVDNIFKEYPDICLGGYLAQSLMTEYILQNKDLHHNDFALGMMYFGIFVNLNNVFKRYIVATDANDLDYYSAYGGNPYLAGIVMVLYSLWALDRIGKETSINQYLSNGTFAWKFDF